MLRVVSLDSTRPSIRTIAPTRLQPLIEAAEKGKNFTSLVRGIIEDLGFDSFMSGWASAPRPDRDSMLYVFTTLPDEWVRHYDKELFIEVDPRIQMAGDFSSAMFSWTAAQLRNRSPRCDRFLDSADRYGVRSGACFGWRDSEGNGVLIAYNSSKSRLDPRALSEKADALYAFGHAFHDIFMRTVIEKGVPSRLRGAALSPREIEALQYVARGLTVQDIGPKMGITPRTVRFHVDSAVTKLGALKRDEAIALAVKGGLLNLLP